LADVIKDPASYSGPILEAVDGILQHSHSLASLHANLLLQAMKMEHLQECEQESHILH